MDYIQNLNWPEADTDGIILYSKDLNIKYEYSITKHYAVNTFLNRQLFKNPSFLICIASIRVFVSHSDTSKIYILGYSTSEQDDLHQQILKASKNNISFPQDVVDLMQCYTENPDDILPKSFQTIWMPPLTWRGILEILPFTLISYVFIYLNFDTRALL